ncbi:unnamed protein product [Albugo candida]|uniref:Uncharacterized protein n=1 Tax=Albugo candida TaxID=65357 RepID=A0A024FT49_9STRA|nr:unnamed protein product [Albugo candida]|eukprot:CCI10166.1 unnamed protein product [Albugo candida]
MRFLHAQRLDQNQTYFACWKCFEKLLLAQSFQILLSQTQLSSNFFWTHSDFTQRKPPTQKPTLQLRQMNKKLFIAICIGISAYMCDGESSKQFKGLEKDKSHQAGSGAGSGAGFAELFCGIGRV